MAAYNDDENVDSENWRPKGNFNIPLGGESQDSQKASSAYSAGASETDQSNGQLPQRRSAQGGASANTRNRQQRKPADGSAHGSQQGRGQASAQYPRQGAGSQRQQTRAAAQGQRQPAASRQGSNRPKSNQRDSFTMMNGAQQGFYGRSSAQGDLVRVKRKKKNRKGLKVALIVLGVIVVLFGAGTAFAAVYYNSLASNISYDGDQEKLNAVLKEADYEAPFYILIIGSDNWEGNGARSDAMVLTRIDLNTSTVTMVSVPRDTPYQINGQTRKLNAVFEEEGAAACVQAVSEVTGVPITHYVELEFDQLGDVVDSLGGVLVDVPYAFDYTVYTGDQPTVHIEAGKQVLDSEKAIALARNRTSYGEDQDAIRQANIRAMMIATMKQVLDAPVSEIPGNIQLLTSMIGTDIPMNELVDWAMKIAQAPKVTVYSCTGPYAGGIDAETGLWLTEYAPESWKALMAAVDAGQDPEGILKASTDGGLMLESAEVIETPVETPPETPTDGQPEAPSQ